MSNATITSRVEQAAKVMGITPSDLWLYLAELGIENSDDGLSLLSADTTQEGDARAVIVEGKGFEIVGGGRPMPQLVKIARFKAGWAILKGKGKDVATPTEGTDGSIAALVQAIQPPAKLTDEALIKLYNPDASTEVCEELKRRSHDRPFVIYDVDETVNVKSTLDLLRIARKQETPSTFPVGAKLCRTYRIGEFPMLWIEECPVHKDKLLADGYCEDCGFSWKDIPMEDRILVRIAVEPLGITCDQAGNASDLVARLKNRPKVLLAHEELEAQEDLPVLRRRMSRGGGKSDPFYVRK